ncbi:11333_t:CDS:2 [Racocetra fulgida]|uniref:Peptidyl-tRNA hydrolase n=1 Tax=Racocetra fulgida TaxID=60492 RepID=A0A9N8VDT1_9GLOM|nr:11333_t:CDS:2 [Racocetra fulgida]
MKLIVGLGNPGKEYENTRHNLGFIIVDRLVQKLNVELSKKKFNGLYCRTSEYILLQPQNYMNNSGECIRAFLNYFRIPVDNLLVIYDDIALPLGKFRYRSQGSAGGHNGVKDIIEVLGILQNFQSAEKEEIKKIIPDLLTDPNTQVGAVIVNQNKEIVATGYNETKYPYVVHAEANAIIHARQNCRGFSLYTTLFPCCECAKLIIQAGIKHIFYSHDKYNEKEEVMAAKRMLKDAGVEYGLVAAPKIVFER